MKGTLSASRQPPPSQGRDALGWARARRRQRGALFVEGLSVVLTIGFLLAVISWFHSVYHTKADTLAAARLEAWQRARAGCRLAAAETLFDRRGERSSLAPGNGAFAGGLELHTRSIVTCNEPPASDEQSLLGAIDSLHALVPWQPEDMVRWLFGSSEPFAGLIGAMEFVGRAVSSAALEVSNARGALVERLGDVLAQAEELAAGAFEWSASLR
jgi:hypothetical protein